MVFFFLFGLCLGDYEQLISPDEPVINGKQCKLFNAIDVANNGDVYWSCSSLEFDLQNGLYDIFADGTGRYTKKKRNNSQLTTFFFFKNSLNYYNPKTKENTVLIDSLIFANGVKLADDESFVLINDLNRNRVLRYHLKGPKKGTHDVFVDGLPGMPDNINSDGKNGFLIPLVVAVDQNHPCVPQMLSQFPLLRRLIARVFGIFELGFTFIERIYPNEIAEKAIHYVGILRLLSIFCEIINFF